MDFLATWDEKKQHLLNHALWVENYSRKKHTKKEVVLVLGNVCEPLRWNNSPQEMFSSIQTTNVYRETTMRQALN